MPPIMLEDSSNHRTTVKSHLGPEIPLLQLLLRNALWSANIDSYRISKCLINRTGVRPSMVRRERADRYRNHWYVVRYHDQPRRPTGFDSHAAESPAHTERTGIDGMIEPSPFVFRIEYLIREISNRGCKYVDVCA
jgi:hypothetical protein